MEGENGGADVQGQEQQGQQLPPQEGQQQQERPDGAAAEGQVADEGYKAALAERAKHVAEPSGATGLEPAGAATSEDADLRHWRDIAGLGDGE